ncbi:MAG: DNA-protecting protein DprA [Clostridia bacterium]|nr:DNA-protecting protein DprA [Clostridia bacterium]
MFSQTALKIYAAKKEGIIKSSAFFWREFDCAEKVNILNLPLKDYEREVNDSGINLICAYDDNFPAVSFNVKAGERPYFFAYKGDISLLYNRVKNVAVVGTLTPDKGIINREREAVKRIVESGCTIVSGLAAGCDTAAHDECLAQKGKTVAFLPSSIERVYPEWNRDMAERIWLKGGLVVTEYVTEPLNKYQRTGRFIERDRLQAMYSANILLVASSLPGQGDCGSRHAMAKAKAYNTKRFVMYNDATDKNNDLFGLNRQLLQEGAAVLTPNVLNCM